MRKNQEQETKKSPGCDIACVLKAGIGKCILVLILLSLISSVNTAGAESLNIIGEGGVSDTNIKSYSSYHYDKLINGYDYYKQNRLYVNKFSKDISKNDAFKFEYRGTHVSFVPQSIYLQSNPSNVVKTKSVTSKSNKDKLNYNELFGINTNYILTDMGNLVKEELVLYTNPYTSASNSDTFVLKHRFDYSGLTPYINGNVWDGKTTISTSNDIIFKNGGIKYFAFVAPYAFDANRNKIKLTYTLSKNEILINVPMSFLNIAKYPITIDPSIDQSGGSISLNGNLSYDYVNLTNGAVLYINPYNGTAGTGELQLNVTYDVNIDATSSINGDTRGYRGGAGGDIYTGGYAGEGSCAGIAGSSGGGLGGGGAGGGGYGTSGLAGTSSTGGTAGGAGGTTCGTSTGTDINMGSGAGGGGGGGSGTPGAGSAGQAGGAMLTINAVGSINIVGTLNFDGGSGGSGGSGYYTGGAGGSGAGGGILINGTNVNLNSAIIYARDGNGLTATGGGRLKVLYYITLTNTNTTVASGTSYYNKTNSAPTIPTITNPTNNSVGYSETSITMNWTTSTDAEGDPIGYTYQIANDSVFTDLMYNTSTASTSSGTKSIPANQLLFFRVRSNDSYGSSVWSATVSIRDLTLTSPADGSTVYFDYPPQTTDVNFTWSATYSTTINYNLIVSTDSYFNLDTYDQTFTGMNKIIPLSADEYWWKVRPYYVDTGTYGAFTPARSFNLTGNQTTVGTAIQGTVYELINGIQIPLSGATVYIQNQALNWSDSMVTGSNGYYLFPELSNTTTYYLFASKTEYQTSIAEYVTTGVGIWTTKDIQLKPTEPTDFESDKQYVKFKARWMWCFFDCDIQGATISVYKSGDVVAYVSGITDSTGSVVFRLYKTQLYRITVVNASAGINQEMTLYPKDTEYVFLITNNESSWQDHPVQEKDAITIGVTKAIINSITATITVNYTDSLAGTSALKYYINQTNASDPYNQTVINSWVWSSGTYNHTFTITNYSGKSYLVHVVAAHSEYDTIDRTYSVFFERTGVGIDAIPSTLWLWFAIGIMFFTAAMFTTSTTEMGFAIVCAEGWIFFFMGMFSSLNIIQFGIGLTLATVIAVFLLIKRSQAREGFT